MDGDTAEDLPEARPGAAAEIEPFGASALVDVGSSPLARRLSALGLGDEPRVLWRRELAPHLHIRVREDGALELYTESVPAVRWPIAEPDAELGSDPWPEPVAIIDTATGTESPPPPKDAWPAPGEGRLTAVRVDPRSGYLIASRSVPDMKSPSITAVDPTSGEVVWQKPAGKRRSPYTNGLLTWLRDDHPDAEMLYLSQFMRGDEPSWTLWDPSTGFGKWSVDMVDLIYLERESPSPAVNDPRDVVIGKSMFHGLIGLRIEDGARVWDISFESREWRRYRELKHPVYAGKSDHCFVLAQLPEREYVQIWSVVVEVHSRATGELLFTREWPDPGVPDTAVADVLDIRSDVLLTREGSFVRGHSLPEGRHLWSFVPPIATTFDASGRHPHSRWAWLRPISTAARKPDPESVAPNGLFVHAATGRTVNLRGAFHHTPDDRVITRTGSELVCWELPGAADD